jgi:flagellar hook-associated protein 2
MPAITFGGVGSGIDTESIIQGLLQASQGPLQRIKQQQSQTDAAVSSLSDIGNLLGNLKSSVVGLDTIQEVGSFKATSDNAAVAVTTTGNAKPGSFQINVSQLASAYKAYSNTLGTTQSNQALNQVGTLSLAIGGKSADITLQASDSLDSVINKINASGLRVSATSFYDGQQFRLQVRGLDTGAANDVTVTEDGTTFGFASNVKSTGKNAELDIDGFHVSSASNQVKGAVDGVTIALANVTVSGTPATINIDSDTKAFQTKLQGLVDSYNSLITRIHKDAGFGTVVASNPELAGDFSLRTVTQRLSASLTNMVGTGKYGTLHSIGLELNNDGTLKLNTDALEKALSDDPNAVTKVLAGDDSTVKGIADIMAGIANDMLGDKGTISARQDGLTAQKKLLADEATTQQAQLDRMETQLRTQFTQMDQLVSASKQQLGFLQSSSR